MGKLSEIQNVSNIKPSINKNKRKGINYPSKIDESRTLEKDNPTIVLDFFI